MRLQRALDQGRVVAAQAQVAQRRSADVIQRFWFDSGEEVMWIPDEGLDTESMEKTAANHDGADGHPAGPVWRLKKDEEDKKDVKSKGAGDESPKLADLEPVWEEVDERDQGKTPGMMSVKHLPSGIPALEGPTEAWGIKKDFSDLGLEEPVSQARVTKPVAANHVTFWCKVGNVNVMAHLTMAGYSLIYGADKNIPGESGADDDATKKGLTGKDLYAEFLKIAREAGGYHAGANECQTFANHMLQNLTNAAEPYQDLFSSTAQDVKQESTTSAAALKASTTTTTATTTKPTQLKRALSETRPMRGGFAADVLQREALADTQGTDNHVGPGQEQHLPHDAWHVVRQKQGRVKPTLQMKGVAIVPGSSSHVVQRSNGHGAADEKQNDVKKQIAEHQADVENWRGTINSFSDPTNTKNIAPGLRRGQLDVLIGALKKSIPARQQVYHLNTNVLKIPDTGNHLGAIAVEQAKLAAAIADHATITWISETTAPHPTDPSFEMVTPAHWDRDNPPAVERAKADAGGDWSVAKKKK